MSSQFVIGSNTWVPVPVIALALYAVASGYLMSLLPLILPVYGMDSHLASYLASIFYAGLLLGTLLISPVLGYLGHKMSFICCLVIFSLTIIVLPFAPYSGIWLVARFIAGITVAGIFVIVESWLLEGDETGRAKRLGIYMAALYGGTSIGQLGIGMFNMNSLLPFMVISLLLLLAVAVLLVIASNEPKPHSIEKIALKHIKRVCTPALIGCLVSGLTLAIVMGLMPVALLNIGVTHQSLGSLMALVIIGGMAVQLFVPSLIRGLGHKLCMAGCALVAASAVAMAIKWQSFYALSASLFILGMALFALYPIAINLGCLKLTQAELVSATQMMLLSYSLGSVAGPLIAQGFMSQGYDLFAPLLVMLILTCVYMLIVSGRHHQTVAG
ncbi:MFS transporter [uncultured Shewanella sp.]|uniref:MFS transporter n=1 Tax=uncultured Shewanella sp. TaxID=173975 RepID=UPI00261AB1CA|nr:MFS transporter [uncultured Shewanella sp.]